MKGRFVAALCGATMVAAGSGAAFGQTTTVQPAGDAFLGTWRLDKSQSVIASDPGVKSKEFVFTPTSQGVTITETLELMSEPGKKQVSHLLYDYGRVTPQVEPGLDALLVVKGDSHTAYWTAEAKGKLAAELQVHISDDGQRMTFRYLWSAADPAGKAFNDRYVYVKQ